MWHWQKIEGTPTPERLKGLLNIRLKQLENELAEIVSRQQGVVTFAAGDTSPSVATGGVFRTANTGATSITTFDDGRNGQRIVLIFKDANTTLVNGATLEINGDANFTGANGDVKEFVLDSTVWREIEQPTTWA